MLPRELLLIDSAAIIFLVAMCMLLLALSLRALRRAEALEKQLETCTEVLYVLAKSKTTRSISPEQQYLLYAFLNARASGEVFDLHDFPVRESSNSLPENEICPAAKEIT